MINLDEYIRFRLLENKMRGCIPTKTYYQGVRVFLNTEPSGPLEKYSYFFHPLFGTIVLYDRDNIGKTQLCEAIDAEIRKEVR